jgi:radical SAM protein with 4Fe4S-binding SPASM domain
MKELADCGCLFLAFTGGEPLLRRDAFDLLSAAAEMSFAVTLQTNATLLTREKARILGEMPTLRADVSLYGARPRTHDYLTGEAGSFAATRRALELLKENGVPVMLKVVVGGFNLDEVDEIAAIADELEAPAMFTSLIFPRNDRDPAPTRLRLDDAGLERFMRFEIAYLPRYLSEVVDFNVEDVVDYVQRCAVGPEDPEGGKRRYCGGGRTVFAINPYGDVYPCVAFPLVIGNIMKNSFVETWRDSPELRELRRMELEIPEECGECSLLDRCGICRALSYQERGEAIAVSREKCRLTRTLMKVLEDA